MTIYNLHVPAEVRILALVHLKKKIMKMNFGNGPIPG